MLYKSFLKIYFLYILNFDYGIYKNLKLNNYVDYFLILSLLLKNTNNCNSVIEQNTNIKFNLIILFLSDQLFQFNFINKDYYNKNLDFCYKKHQLKIKNNHTNLFFNFLDNLFIFYYYICLFNFINHLTNHSFSFNLNNFLPKQIKLRENFLFNFKIKFHDFNKNLQFNFNLIKLN